MNYKKFNLSNIKNLYFILFLKLKFKNKKKKKNKNNNEYTKC